MIRMTMSDGAVIDVYRVLPEGDRRGGLVLVQEIFGITDHIRDQCERWAADGYEVLAPSLFDREAPGFVAPYDDIDEAIRLSREVHPFELSVADVQNCIDSLAPPVFVVGYCYGGSVAFRAAQRCSGLAAASAYYGRFVPDFADDGPPRCPTIAHFGRRDPGIPIDGVERLIERRLPDLTVHLYDAGHGFNSDRRADYDAASARLARERTLALFRANGG